MLFSGDLIEETNDEIVKKEQELKGDQRENVPAGVHEMYLNELEFDTNDKGVHIIKLTHNIDADAKTFKDVKKAFYFDLEGIDTDDKKREDLLNTQKRFIEYLKKTFDYTLKPGDLKSAFAQISKFKGKKLKVAVRQKEKLMTMYVYEDGKKTDDILGYKIIKTSDFYYSGKITDDKFSLKEDKKFQKLPEKDLEIIQDHRNTYPERYDDNGLLILSNSSKDSDEDKQEETPKPKKATAAKKESVDEPSSETISFLAKSGDDLDW